MERRIFLPLGVALSNAATENLTPRLTPLIIPLLRRTRWRRQGQRGETMKAEIHPEYVDINVSCACGNEFKTRSTRKTDLQVEICAACHPFFTGKQKLIDTAGRVDRFNKRYART
jgi:large subunit ribosomal protein L31